MTQSIVSNTFLCDQDKTVKYMVIRLLYRMESLGNDNPVRICEMAFVLWGRGSRKEVINVLNGEEFSTKIMR